jgi:tape measure domain-containing protein
MAQYPIDINIKTGQAATGLDQLEAKLNSTEKATIAAAQAANQLSTSTDSVAKATVALIQQQINQLSRTAAVAKSTRESSQASLDNINAYKQTVTSASDLNKYRRTEIELQKVIANQTRIESQAISDLAIAQTKLNDVSAPFIAIEQKKKAAQEAATRVLAEQSQQYKLHQISVREAQAAQSQLNKSQAEAQRVANQLKAENDRLTKSNSDYITSLRQQVQVAKATGIEAEKLKNSFKLNATATKEQRDETAKLTEELGRLKEAQKQPKSGLDQLVLAGKAFIGLSIVQKLGEWGKAFVTTADEIQSLRTQIGGLTGSQEDAANKLQQLTVIANKNGVTIKNTARAYSDLYLSAKSMGKTSNDVIQLVSNLQLAARLSGAKSDEASRAITQLSQAFAIGKVQGQDFKAMIQNMPIILDLMSKATGKSAGELRRMATDGKFTTDMMFKLNDLTKQLEDKTSKLPRTVEQASNALSNSLGLAVDTLNQKLGITITLAKGLDSLAKTLDQSTRMASGTFNEYNQLGKQVDIVASGIERLKEVSKGIDPASMTGKNYAKEIANQQKLLDGLKEQIKVADNLSKITNQLGSDVIVARTPKELDYEAEKALQKLREQNELSKKSGEEQAKLAAVQKLGANASKEQREEAERLAVSTYRASQAKKEDVRSTREQESAARRAVRELERNQEANRKYIDGLKEKVGAGTLDLEATKIAIQLSKAQSTANEDQVFSIQHLTQMMNMYSLAADQKLALSKLNKDATDEERAAVDQYTEALYRQKQAAEAAQAYSGLTTDLTRAKQNDVENKEADVGAQEAARYLILAQARLADIINQQEYEAQKTAVAADAAKQRQKITVDETKNQLTASASLFSGFSQLAAAFQGDSENKNKIAFAAAKAFAVASAGVNFSAALMSALADPSALTLPQKIANYATVAALGAGLINNITSQNFAYGGYVSGSGTGRSDSVRANLSNGEFVSTADTTSRYRNTLEAMNNGTYRESGSSGATSIKIINNSSQALTGSIEYVTRDEVSLILQDEVPVIMTNQFADPYSKSNRTLKNNYNLERNL